MGYYGHGLTTVDVIWCDDEGQNRAQNVYHILISLFRINLQLIEYKYSRLIQWIKPNSFDICVLYVCTQSSGLDRLNLNLNPHQMQIRPKGKLKNFSHSNVMSKQIELHRFMSKLDASSF